MGNPWDAVTDGIVSAIRKRSEKFLEDNKDAAEFLQDRAKRLAKLLWAYSIAGDGESRKAVSESIAFVRQSIDNEISAVAVKANAQARSLFENVLKGAFDAVVKTLPVLLGAL